MSIKYFAYGDESVNNNIVAYSIFACPPAHIEEAVEILKSSKINQKEANDYSLHARVLFSKDQRRKAGCECLDDDDVFKVYEKLFDSLNKPHFKKIIAIADKREFPKEMATSNTIVSSLKITDKSLISFCGNISLLPFFHAFGNLECLRFFADNDHTKIDWLGKKRQARHTLDMFMSNDSMSKEDVSKCRVSPEPYKEKPKLLEIADGIAYFSAKALSVQAIHDKHKILNVFEKISPLQVVLTRDNNDRLGAKINNTLTMGYLGEPV